MPRGAVIVIGSNSTRYVSADLNGQLSNPLRRRVKTRLFLHMQGSRLTQDDISRTALQAAGLLRMIVHKKMT